MQFETIGNARCDIKQRVRMRRIGVIDAVYMPFENSIKVQRESVTISHFGGLYSDSCMFYAWDHQEFSWINNNFELETVVLVILLSSASLSSILSVVVVAMAIFSMSCPCFSNQIEFVCDVEMNSKSMYQVWLSVAFSSCFFSLRTICYNFSVFLRSSRKRYFNMRCC